MFFPSIFRESSLLPSVVDVPLVNYATVKNYPKCPYCKLNFKKNSDLKNHLEEKEWKLYIEQHYPGYLSCETCSVFFKNQRILNQHLGKTHSNEGKYYQCMVCRKCFKNRHALKFHNKQVHEKSTRVVCEHCGKELYSKYLMPDHLQRFHSEQLLDN